VADPLGHVDLPMMRTYGHPAGDAVLVLLLAVGPAPKQTNAYRSGPVVTVRYCTSSAPNLGSVTLPVSLHPF
jgi:hypothetical protein